MSTESFGKLGRIVSPAEAMRLAIREGEGGAGFVSPNPLVGCAIVGPDHKLLSLGFHRKLGEDHAEIDALKKLGPDSRKVAGCHIYVTLEPCAHQGRTPSCARTLAPLKPASVTYAVKDPNPLVAGRGAEILRESGIKVASLAERSDIDASEREDLIEAAEDLAEIFLHNHRSGEPFVAVKVASSLDGQIAFVSGESKWITGEEARSETHLLRAQYDAVMIGRSTFEADNPSLNVRHTRYTSVQAPQSTQSTQMQGFQNRVVLLDPRGSTLSQLSQSNLLKAHSPDRVFVVTEPNCKEANPSGVRVIHAPVLSGGEFEIPILLRELKSAGLASVMIEGGARTYGAFFNAGRVRRLHAFIAPILMGGRHGVSWSHYFGGESMADRIVLERVSTSILGRDIHFNARVIAKPHGRPAKVGFDQR